jgi:phosphoribosylamine--glycine ligase
LRNAGGDPVEIARTEAVDLAIVGPEVPLCEGLVDRLTDAGILSFGPTAGAARLEGSKAFMKRLCERHGVRTARFEVVRGVAELDGALGKFDQAPVVKADGLCAGKGVVVTHSKDEARSTALEMLSGRPFGDAGRTVVLEERLTGFETSIHAICDGERFLILPPAQDHKRIGEGDTGPNTGGMGAYAPTPLVSAELLQRIRREVLERVLEGMVANGSPFRGALFAGLMISPAGDPEVVEFNVRFGDPETQVLIDLIDGDFAELLTDAALGTLKPSPLITPPDRHSVCVVLAAEGYPASPRKGDAISGIEEAEALGGVRVYHAGTERDGSNLVTAGGRVLGLTATRGSLRAARDLAYQAADMIHFDGKQLRRDIAASALER